MPAQYISASYTEQPEIERSAHPAVVLAIQRGWHVVPVGPTSKRPLFKASQTNGCRWGCSNDPRYVERLFARPRARAADVGLACGPESGLFVVDIDTMQGHGVDGPASLRALEAKYGPMPVTLTALTPSGGIHYYFCYPTGGCKVISRSLRDDRDNVIEGIDIKGWGGYVVTVPSKGRIWQDENSRIAEALSWLLDLVCAKPGTKLASRRPPIEEGLSNLQSRWHIRPRMRHVTASLAFQR
jgi:hypothetical protein